MLEYENIKQTKMSTNNNTFHVDTFLNTLQTSYQKARKYTGENHSQIGGQYTLKRKNKTKKYVNFNTATQTTLSKQIQRLERKMLRYLVSSTSNNQRNTHKQSKINKRYATKGMYRGASS